MYCPKCATQATPGQRFCRTCGTNLSVILDAIDDSIGGKRGPIDFEVLKADLRELGANLRVGFEEARQGFKQATGKTRRLDTAPKSSPPPAEAAPPVKLEPLRVKKVRGGSTRRYSLQQSILGIFGGGATAGVLYHLLNTAAGSGLLGSLEQMILRDLEVPPPGGFVPIFQMLWMLGLIPVVKGVAHLINGIFFPVKPEPETKEVVISTAQRIEYTAAPPQPLFRTDVSQFLGASHQSTAQSSDPPASITEDDTVRFGSRETN
ncbi:MAG: zinc ribbon domain-containing protein [Acidobacteria bacterium]|nr:zinc ribbon domain-containing protein [Acidobacteriota bacterium]MCW5970591.1 zinc ribbon domain-containing protein [Blastocatellales bacterium]